MGRLDADTVNNAANALNARARGAIDTIENRKTVLSGWFGNNETLEQNAGAIKTLLGDNGAIEHWRGAGLNAVDDDSRVDSWLETGKTIESTIAAIDGYADGATLASTVKLTAAQTIKDTAQVANTVVQTAAKFAWQSLPWYVIGGVVLVGASVIYFKVIRK